MSAPSAVHQNVVPSEVGWQFVPQYYNFVNKHPELLHRFYTKSSTVIHGTEGEEATACFGQKEIHDKIVSIGFDQCKVFIHSVDAQSSANGGIIIQVIGEMSNAAKPWRKFVQTFFLAEQPNGYFVLNDIFRYIKEESFEGDDNDWAGEPASAPEVSQRDSQDPAYVAHSELNLPQVEAPLPEVAAAPVADTEAPTTDISEPIAEDVHALASEVAVPVVPQLPAASPRPAPASIISYPQLNGNYDLKVEEPSKPESEKAPAMVVPASSVRASSPVSAAPPAAPAAPRSWAALAAGTAKRWGPTVAQEPRAAESSPTPSSGAQTPAAPSVRPPQQSQQHGVVREHQALTAASSVATPHCFVKGVTDVITHNALTSALKRFGPIKECEIISAKGCAFVEFENVESARRAIIASLSQNQGGEGGVRISAGEDVVRINVETKKERSERPASRPRGDGRGGAFRGRMTPRGGRGTGTAPKQ